MRAVVRAPLLSISGYGQHSRQIYEALKNSDKITEIKTQVVQWGNTSWFIDVNAENGLIGDIMSRSSDVNDGYDISFQVQLPDEWSTSLAKINIGVTAAVETDRCNPEWINRCNQMNAIIVPSHFTKSVLEKTGQLTVPVHVIGEWYIDEINRDVPKLDLDFRTPFNFLIVSQLTAVDSSVDRKNITNTVKWLCETFKDDPSVGIVLKTNSGRGTEIDRVATENALLSIIKPLRETSKVPVYLLHGNMTNTEIASLYRHPKIKALVSLTRGEGFGLPLLEAAASSLPVIATDWSAHTEFLNLGKWIKIEQDLVNIPDVRIDNRIFVKDVKWSNPREDSFKKKSKKFRESFATPESWAKELSHECKKNFSKDAIIIQYSKFLDGLLSND